MFVFLSPVLFILINFGFIQAIFLGPDWQKYFNIKFLGKLLVVPLDLRCLSIFAVQQEPSGLLLVTSFPDSPESSSVSLIQLPRNITLLSWTILRRVSRHTVRLAKLLLCLYSIRVEKSSPKNIHSFEFILIPSNIKVKCIWNYLFTASRINNHLHMVMVTGEEGREKSCLI